MQQNHVAIIGAGPIGIELAVAFKRAGLDYVHFDASQVGHTISWFAPQTRFFSSNDRIAIAGVPLQTSDQSKATREQYLAYLRSVVQQFDLPIRTYEPVIAIERLEGDFLLRTQAGGHEHLTRVQRLVLATGGTARPRRLGIPGEDLAHVSHYFQDPHTYFRKKLLIIGGRNSAIEAALRCHAAGAKVSLSYRRPRLEDKSIKYWLMPEITGLLDSGQIAGYFDSQPLAVAPSHVTLQFPDRTLDVETDFVLPLIGYEADMSLCRMAGVELTGDNHAPVFNPRTMETNVPGVYVAGTVTGGTQQRYKVFIENCHIHTDRILASLLGKTPPHEPASLARPES